MWDFREIKSPIQNHRVFKSCEFYFGVHVLEVSVLFIPFVNVLLLFNSVNWSHTVFIKLYYLVHILNCEANFLTYLHSSDWEVEGSSHCGGSHVREGVRGDPKFKLIIWSLLCSSKVPCIEIWSDCNVSKLEDLSLRVLMNSRNESICIQLVFTLLLRPTFI
jgi:hypothetical protein